VDGSISLVARIGGGHDALSLVGTPATLLSLAEALDRGCDTTLRLAEGVDPTPYLRTANVLRVVVEAACDVSVAVDGDVVTVRGAAPDLAILAENVKSLGEHPGKGKHLHIEYFPDHFYLRADSHPMVVEVDY
jgi:hypothetical protein